MEVPSASCLGHKKVLLGGLVRLHYQHYCLSDRKQNHHFPNCFATVRNSLAKSCYNYHIVLRIPRRGCLFWFLKKFFLFIVWNFFPCSSQDMEVSCHYNSSLRTTSLFFFFLMQWCGCFPGGSVGKESAYQYRRSGFNPCVRKIPWRREWQPTLVFLTGEFHGQRRLGGYSPWSCKESDMKLSN